MDKKALDKKALTDKALTDSEAGATARGGYPAETSLGFSSRSITERGGITGLDGIAESSGSVLSDTPMEGKGD